MKFMYIFIIISKIKLVNVKIFNKSAVIFITEKIIIVYILNLTKYKIFRVF